jgi:hypothetical protein
MIKCTFNCLLKVTHWPKIENIRIPEESPKQQN